MTRTGKPPSLWRCWDEVPAELRLLMGSAAEREKEARAQGVFETAETKARRGRADTSKA
jgi:hypothetical protein